MEHVIRQKRTLLIVGADEDDVRDFVASARAHAVPRELWPENERFETTGCTWDAIPRDRAFDAVILTRARAVDPVTDAVAAVGAACAPTGWLWVEPIKIAHAAACSAEPRSVVRMVREKPKPSPEHIARYAAIAEEARAAEEAKRVADLARCDAVRAVVSRVLPGCDVVVNIYGDGSIVVTSHDADDVITFDALAALAEAFRTREINFKRVEGWEGTDVTPGDSDTIEIRITGVGAARGWCPVIGLDIVAARRIVEAFSAQPPHLPPCSTFDDALRAMLVGGVAELRTGDISDSEIWEDATVGQLVASVPIADGAAVFTTDRDLGTDWHVLIRSTDGKPFLYYRSESWQRLAAGDTFNLRGIGPDGGGAMSDKVRIERAEMEVEA